MVGMAYPMRADTLKTNYWNYSEPKQSRVKWGRISLISLSADGLLEVQILHSMEVGVGETSRRKLVQDPKSAGTMKDP